MKSSPRKPFRCRSSAGQNESGQDSIAIRYGSIGRLALHRRLEPAGAVVDRGLLALGGAPGEPDRLGLWVRGSVDTLDADGWLALKRQSELRPRRGNAGRRLGPRRACTRCLRPALQ